MNDSGRGQRKSERDEGRETTVKGRVRAGRIKGD